MKAGDLVKFSERSGWMTGIRGKIGVVVAIKQHRPYRPGWRLWSCLIDEELVEGFNLRLDDPSYLERWGVEVICG